MSLSTTPRQNSMNESAFTDSYRLAKTARSKLAFAVKQSDLDLRRLVSHANLLDTVMNHMSDMSLRPKSEDYTNGVSYPSILYNVPEVDDENLNDENGKKENDVIAYSSSESESESESSSGSESGSGSESESERSESEDEEEDESFGSLYALRSELLQTASSNKNKVTFELPVSHNPRAMSSSDRAVDYMPYTVEAESDTEEYDDAYSDSEDEDEVEEEDDSYSLYGAANRHKYEITKDESYDDVERLPELSRVPSHPLDHEDHHEMSSSEDFDEKDDYDRQKVKNFHIDYEIDYEVDYDDDNSDDDYEIDSRIKKDLFYQIYDKQSSVPKNASSGHSIAELDIYSPNASSLALFTVS